MKFAFFSTMTGMLWGGSEELWSRAARMLLEHGHEVCINYARRPQPVPKLDQLAAMGAEVHYRSPNRWGRSVRRLLERMPGRETPHLAWLRSTAPDYVLASLGYHDDDVTIASACAGRGIPYGMLLQSASPNHWIEWRNVDYQRAAYSRAADCFFVSQLNRDIIEANLAIELTRAKIIDNPFNVSPDANPPWPSAEPNWKLACVARIHYASKGQDLVLQLMRQPKWRARNIELTLFGHDGGSRGHAQRWVEAHGLQSRVTLGGYSQSIEQVWSQHHALVLPSRYEGNPLAMIEAMMCGRLAITTNVGRVGELIDDNESGFIIPAATVELLDDAMERAWQQRHDWRAIGARAAAGIRARHSMTPAEDFADELLASAKASRVQRSYSRAA